VERRELLPVSRGLHVWLPARLAERPLCQLQHRDWRQLQRRAHRRLRMPGQYLVRYPHWSLCLRPLRKLGQRPHSFPYPLQLQQPLVEVPELVLAHWTDWELAKVEELAPAVVRSPDSEPEEVAVPGPAQEAVEHPSALVHQQAVAVDPAAAVQGALAEETSVSVVWNLQFLLERGQPAPLCREARQPFGRRPRCW
jgi:hypothetical protein